MVPLPLDGVGFRVPRRFESFLSPPGGASRFLVEKSQLDDLKLVENEEAHPSHMGWAYLLMPGVYICVSVPAVDVRGDECCDL